jgi:hypothetical protein
MKERRARDRHTERERESVSEMFKMRHKMNDRQTGTLVITKWQFIEGKFCSKMEAYGDVTAGYIYIYIYIYNTHTKTYRHTHTHIQTYIHTHTHTNRNKNKVPGRPYFPPD